MLLSSSWPFATAMSLLESVWFCRNVEKGPIVAVAAVSRWALVDVALEARSEVVMSALARFARRGEVGNGRGVGKYWFAEAASLLSETLEAEVVLAWQALAAWEALNSL